MNIFKHTETCSTKGFIKRLLIFCNNRMYFNYIYSSYKLRRTKKIQQKNQ